MFIYYSIKEFIYTLFTKYKKPSRVQGLHVKTKKEVLDVVRKSFSIRVVDAGDDEGTMVELYALESPEYSTESVGLHVVASPKHGDALLIVGAIADNMKQAVLDAYDSTPHPKVVIACGDKAINGDKRFYGAKTGVRDILPVDLEIPGNPPKAIDIYSYINEYLNS